jgi:hypothetical protein
MGSILANNGSANTFTIDEGYDHTATGECPIRNGNTVIESANPTGTRPIIRRQNAFASSVGPGSLDNLIIRNIDFFPTEDAIIDSPGSTLFAYSSNNFAIYDCECHSNIVGLKWSNILGGPSSHGLLCKIKVGGILRGTWFPKGGDALVSITGAPSISEWNVRTLGGGDDGETKSQWIELFCCDFEAPEVYRPETFGGDIVGVGSNGNHWIELDASTDMGVFYVGQLIVLRAADRDEFIYMRPAAGQESAYGVVNSIDEPNKEIEVYRFDGQRRSVNPPVNDLDFTTGLPNLSNWPGAIVSILPFWRRNFSNPTETFEVPFSEKGGPRFGSVSNSGISRSRIRGGHLWTSFNRDSPNLHCHIRENRIGRSWKNQGIIMISNNAEDFIIANNVFEQPEWDSFEATKVFEKGVDGDSLEDQMVAYRYLVAHNTISWGTIKPVWSQRDPKSKIGIPGVLVDTDFYGNIIVARHLDSSTPIIDAESTDALRDWRYNTFPDSPPTKTIVTKGVPRVNLNEGEFNAKASDPQVDGTTIYRDYQYADVSEAQGYLPAAIDDCPTHPEVLRDLNLAWRGPVSNRGAVAVAADPPEPPEGPPGLAVIRRRRRR